MSVSVPDMKGEKAQISGYQTDFEKCVENAQTQEEIENCKVLEEGCGGCKIDDDEFVCDYPEEAITCYWATNVTGNTEKFGVDENIRVVDDKIDQKLVEHGLLGWKRYADFMESIYQDPSIEQLAITHAQARVYIDEDELRNALYKHITERLEETYGDYQEFQNLQEIKEKLDNWDELDRQEKNLTFDEAIHAVHLTGNVMGIDVEGLREDFEDDIDEYV